jgi:hypothetical protein
MKEKLKNVLGLTVVLLLLLSVSGCSGLTDNGTTDSNTTSKVSPVTFSPSAGDVADESTVTLATATADATVIYSLDSGLSASTYAEMITAGTAFMKSTVTIHDACTVYALAVKTGYTSSDVTNAAYTIKVGTAKVEAVSITAADATVTTNTAITLSTGTAGAVIYYTTDDSEPTTSSTEYTAPFTLPFAGSYTVKAVAVKTDMIDSETVSASFTVTAAASEITYAELSGTANYDFDGNIDDALTAIGSSSSSVTFTSSINVSGIVTIVNTTNNYFVVQDKNDAVEFYGITMPSGLAAGDYVTASASKGQLYKGLPEITAVDGSVTIDSSKKTATLYYLNLTGKTDFSGFESFKLYGMKAAASAVQEKLAMIYGYDKTTKDTEKSFFGYVQNYSGTLELAVVYEKDASLITTTSSLTNTVEPVSVSIASGTVSSGTTITLSTITEGVTIYYTTDGTVPTSSSNTYSDGITLTGSAGTKLTVTAVALKTGYTDSAIVSAEYTIKDSGGVSDEKLMITEYYEGTSYNKYLEITNIGDTALDLSSYSVGMYYNSDTSVSTSHVLTLSGTLNAGKSVVLYNNQTDLTVLTVLGAMSDTVSDAAGWKVVDTSVCSTFNGNDCIVLMKGGTTSAAIIDAFGTYPNTSGANFAKDTRACRNAGCTPSASYTVSDWTSASISTTAAGDDANAGTYTK